jgi:oligopeptide/dipeptide ABC transporter ATP-binding protein
MLLEAQGLKRHYRVPDRATWFGHHQVQAVDGVGLSLDAGETLGLVGESGCGKSTLGRLLLRLEKPDEGSLRILGKDWAGASEAELRPLRGQAQMVFQDPYGSLNPRLKAWDAVTESLLAQGLAAQARREAAAALLDKVGLPQSSLDRHPHAFSGGQRQRLSIARALASHPRLLIADEPVSSLDLSVQAQILLLLKSLQQEQGLALLFISHDLRVLRQLCDRVAVMYLGRIVEQGPASEVLERPCHPYTQALLAAAPPHPLAPPKPAGQRRAPHPLDLRASAGLAGEPPSPIHPPSGCRFHPRCPLAQPRCSSEPPLLKDSGPLRQAACHLIGTGS